MTIDKYIELLRLTADQIRQCKDGQKFDDTPRFLAELWDQQTLPYAAKDLRDALGLRTAIH